MIIDFHTHVFSDDLAKRAIPLMELSGKIKAESNGTIAELIRSMVEANVNYSVVLPVATSAKQTSSINKFAVMINETYPNLISFGGINPDNKDYKEILDGLKNSGIKGIKLHPDYQDTFIDDERFVRIIDYAFQIGLIVLTHAGVDVGINPPIKATPERILNMLNRLHNKGKLIIAHMGGFMMWDEVYDKIAGMDVYFDMAYCIGKFIYDGKPQELMDEKTFKKFLNKHGSDHILFATDSPWKNQKEMLDVLDSFNIDPKDLENIRSLNAIKLLKLKV